MKKYISYMFAAMLLPLCAGAQTSRGDWTVGGNLGFENVNDAQTTSSIPAGQSEKWDDNFRNATFLLYGEGFVRDNFSLGIDLGYSFLRNRTDDSEHSSKSIHRTVTLRPYAAWYLPIAEKFFFTLSAGPYIGFNYTKSTTTPTDPMESPYSFSGRNYTAGASVLPGFVLFLSKSVGLRASVGKLDYSYTWGGNMGHDNVRFDFYWNSASLGLSYCF